MKLHELFADDDAVSPVIGVILMVAITVILAAVIGTFVLGLGGQVQDTAPNAQFTFDQDGSLTMTHDGGENVMTSNIKTVNDNTGENYGPDEDDICQNNDDTDIDDWTSTELSAGDDCTIPEDNLNPGDTVRIVWESNEGGTSTTLATYEYNG